MSMISLHGWSEETTGFLSISGLSFPPDKKGGKKLVEMLAIYHCEYIAVGHLARHLLAAKPKALC
jgi:hypothetical protein